MAQQPDITGFWNGKANVYGTILRLEINIEEDYSGTVKSPDQGDGSVPLSQLRYEKDSLFFAVEDFKLDISGKVISEELIEAQINQMGASYSIDLVREQLEAEEVVRPQTPQAPFPYTTEDLIFTNQKDDVNLAGTLVWPENATDDTPILVFITGSGPQNRDEELTGHSFFWVIADHLGRNGIASFRYDDRGIAESTGDFNTATTSDLARDASSVVSGLASRKQTKDHPIGLIGHSEGGTICPMVVSQNDEVDFVISLAGTGITGLEIIEKQSKAMAIAEGTPPQAAEETQAFAVALCQVALENDKESDRKKAIEAFLKEQFTPEEIEMSGGIDAMTELYNNLYATDWMREFLKLDPSEYWSKTKCPALILNGTKDTQVEAAANLKAIEYALRRAGNKNYSIRALKDHNHLFQVCKTGGLSEYGQIETTVSSETLDIIVAWVNKL